LISEASQLASTFRFARVFRHDVQFIAADPESFNADNANPTVSGETAPMPNVTLPSLLDRTMTYRGVLVTAQMSWLLLALEKLCTGEAIMICRVGETQLNLSAFSQFIVFA
jgi:hypothetical protein